MDDMVERVARALADSGHLGVSLAFEPIHDTDKGSIPLLKRHDTERATALARAAIEAMRGPTTAMVVAGTDKMESGAGQTGLTVWWAMIDAALTTP